MVIDITDPVIRFALTFLLGSLAVRLGFWACVAWGIWRVNRAPLILPVVMSVLTTLVLYLAVTVGAR